jgi:hypothetical protein
VLNTTFGAAYCICLAHNLECDLAAVEQSLGALMHVKKKEK